jgi:hypothetical protein
MAALDPHAEHERIAAELRALRAEMLRVKEAHPGLTGPELVQKLTEHASLKGALTALVRDALRLGEVVKAIGGATDAEQSGPADGRN